MSRDWNALAAASGAGIPADQIDRTVKPLIALDEAFRPLAAQLRFDDEPATILSEDAE
jgi:hypothetical protein